MGRFYRIVAQDGSPVVAEVPLLPRDDQGGGGDWSHDPSVVPSAGLPGRVMKGLHLGDVTKQFPKIVEVWDRSSKGYIRTALLKELGITTSLEVVTRRPGRRGRDDRYYATWAAAYVDRVEHGSRTPVADLSKDRLIRIEGYSSSEDQCRDSACLDGSYTSRLSRVPEVVANADGNDQIPWFPPIASRATMRILRSDGSPAFPVTPHRGGAMSQPAEAPAAR